MALEGHVSTRCHALASCVSDEVFPGFPRNLSSVGFINEYFSNLTFGLLAGDIKLMSLPTVLFFAPHYDSYKRDRATGSPFTHQSSPCPLSPAIYRITSGETHSRRVRYQRRSYHTSRRFRRIFYRGKPGASCLAKSTKMARSSICLPVLRSVPCWLERRHERPSDPNDSALLQCKPFTIPFTLSILI